MEKALASDGNRSFYHRAELGNRRKHGQTRYPHRAFDLAWQHLLQNHPHDSICGCSIDKVHADLIDRPKLLKGLARGAAERGRDLDCLVQVNLDPDAAAGSGRGGAAPDEVVALAEQLAGTEHLRLRGVMAVAPQGEDPRPAFDRLARLADLVRRVEPSATWVSAGMSGDLEEAVGTGATHVRIGSAVLGPRPPLG